MRIVIDSNVFISGLLGSRNCRKIFLSFKEGAVDLFIPETLLKECIFVIERPKFRLLINNEEKEDIISFIKSHAIFIKPKEKINICRDIKDNKVLECASEARPDFIVTGDKDLLVLKSFRGIPIIKPKDFIIRLKGK